MMKRALTIALLVLLLVGMATGVTLATVGNIKNTKHDLSSGNTTPGALTSNESEICVFCHTPHNATKKVPLWNHTTTTSSFTLYTSSTLDTAAAFEADRSNISVLCLSCHDGSVALGAAVRDYDGMAISMNSNSKLTGGALNDTSYAKLGTDLSNDHPVGIEYKSDAADLNQAASGKGPFVPIASRKVQVYGTSNKVECASCHAVHGGTGTEPFLRMNNSSSALCLECHKK